MLIDLEQLPKEGKHFDINFQEVYEETLFNIALIEAYIFKDKGDAILIGKLHFEIEEICDRCLSTYNLVVNEKINLRLTRNPYIHKKLSTNCEIHLSDDDLNTIYIESLIIEINDIIIREAEALRPMQKLCKPTCKGLCSRCGTNLNVFTCNCKNEESFFFNIGQSIK